MATLDTITKTILSFEPKLSGEDLCKMLTDKYQGDFFKMALAMNSPEKPRPWVTLCHGPAISAYLLGWRSDCKSDHGTDDVGLHGHGDSKVFVCCLYGTIGHSLCYGREKVIPEVNRVTMTEGDTAMLPVGAIHNMCGSDGCAFGISLHVYKPGLLKMEYFDTDPDGRLCQIRAWEEA